MHNIHIFGEGLAEKMHNEDERKQNKTTLGRKCI